MAADGPTVDLGDANAVSVGIEFDGCDARAVGAVVDVDGFEVESADVFEATDVIESGLPVALWPVEMMKVLLSHLPTDWQALLPILRSYRFHHVSLCFLGVCSVSPSWFRFCI